MREVSLFLLSGWYGCQQLHAAGFVVTSRYERDNNKYYYYFIVIFKFSFRHRCSLVKLKASHNIVNNKRKGIFNKRINPCAAPPLGQQPARRDHLPYFDLISINRLAAQYVNTGTYIHNADRLFFSFVHSIIFDCVSRCVRPLYDKHAFVLQRTDRQIMHANNQQ